MTASQRLTALFSGRVQGVGFRFTARQVASRHSVAGYVRNLEDGRVELVVEGAADDLQAYLADLRREMAHCRHSVETHSAPASGQFQSFSIRH